jgi:DNA-binding MarR family transcriptional regulator
MIDRLPDVSAREVAAAMHLHKSTVTGILQRLQHQGLIRRDVHPEDARRVRLRVTPKGRRVGATQGLTVQRAVQRGLSQLPRRKIDAAEEVLSAVAAALRATSRSVSGSNGRRRA